MPARASRRVGKGFPGMGFAVGVQIQVRVGDGEYVAQEGLPFTFGRSRDCTVCLDPDDTAVPRIAGELVHDKGLWWLTNRSTTRPLAVVDESGLRNLLLPGRRTVIETPTRVLVDGVGNRQHSLLLIVEAPVGDPAAPTGTGLPTTTGTELVNAADRLAMVALFAGYLEEPPRYDPNPKSYAAAAARLGWPRTTLVRRIEHLRIRLHGAGVPNMTGFNALTNLAEYAISQGLVTREDLALLRRG